MTCLSQRRACCACGGIYSGKTKSPFRHPPTKALTKRACKSNHHRAAYLYHSTAARRLQGGNTVRIMKSIVGFCLLAFAVNAPILALVLGL